MRFLKKILCNDDSSSCPYHENLKWSVDFHQKYVLLLVKVATSKMKNKVLTKIERDKITEKRLRRLLVKKGKSN